VQFGVWPVSRQAWADAVDVAGHCASTAWDSLYFADHFMPNGPDATPLDGDTLECWTVLTAFAALFPGIKLGSLVASVTYRHPAILAKTATIVDRISGGCFVLGVGTGWQRNEHASYGLELGTVKERIDRFEEAVAIMKSMLSEERTTFAGEYFTVTDAPNQPAPVNGSLPLLIGASGERRMLRVAARWADEWNTWSTPDVLAHKLGVLRGHAEDLGRDPAEIHVSTQALFYLSTDEAWLADKRGMRGAQPTVVGTPSEVVDIVGRYRDAGCDELIVPDWNLGIGQERRDTYDLFREEVAVHFR
jgi:alkanesulfonate monooxygenase SsuD/methylene tetrahydromethanopterin reductase-like flavin-dependent oxidoreductase (luciferase family)